jgi:hypothetical protein
MYAFRCFRRFSSFILGKMTQSCYWSYMLGVYHFCIMRKAKLYTVISHVHRNDTLEEKELLCDF